jgi:hypothetical protein
MLLKIYFTICNFQRARSLATGFIQRQEEMIPAAFGPVKVPFAFFAEIIFSGRLRRTVSGVPFVGE